jgi:hypothetical protein
MSELKQKKEERSSTACSVSMPTLFPSAVTVKASTSLQVAYSILLKMKKSLSGFSNVLLIKEN